MKKILFIMVIIINVGIVYAGERDEITLFDSGGNAIAYIDTSDRDLTIYLWNGNPVAYLFSESNSYHIYGFNGNHLGWFSNGIVRDHDGYSVGATRDAFSGITRIEPIKSIKKIKPIQNVRRISPITPIFRNTWSRTGLNLFLQTGAR